MMLSPKDAVVPLAALYIPGEAQVAGAPGGSFKGMPQAPSANCPSIAKSESESEITMVSVQAVDSSGVVVVRQDQYPLVQDPEPMRRGESEEGKGGGGVSCDSADEGRESGGGGKETTEKCRVDGDGGSGGRRGRDDGSGDQGGHVIVELLCRIVEEGAKSAVDKMSHVLYSSLQRRRMQVVMPYV